MNRIVRTIAYKQEVYLDIEYAEYQARCDCSKRFRSVPDGVESRCEAFAGIPEMAIGFGEKSPFFCHQFFCHENSRPFGDQTEIAEMDRKADAAALSLFLPILPVNPDPQR